MYSAYGRSEQVLEIIYVAVEVERNAFISSGNVILNIISASVGSEKDLSKMQSEYILIKTF